jgi:glycerophosphoryl diester phosphodiesterase
MGIDFSKYHTPVVFAHRGASGHKHDNTFESFDHAIALGTDGLETDAWLLADGEVALYHDKSIPTPEGELVNISKITLPELKKLTLPNGEKIPTLREFFQRYASAKTPYGQPILFSIDLQDLKVGNAMIPIIREFNMLDRVVLCATAIMPMKKVRTADPDVLLVASNLPGMINNENLGEGSKAKELNIMAFNIQIDSYEHGMKETLKQHGYNCFLWDLHTEEALKKSLPLQPDAIYSNFPDLAISMRNQIRGLKL